MLARSTRLPSHPNNTKRESEDETRLVPAQGYALLMTTPLFTSRLSGISVPDQMEVETLCDQLEKVYNSFYRKVYESVEENFKLFASDLREQGLIITSTDTDKLTYDEILKQVFAGFQFSNNVQALEKKCQKFLSSLAEVGNQSAAISREIRKCWNQKATEMKICTDFLSFETCK